MIAAQQQKHADKYMEALRDEVSRLQEWFRREYPESTLRVIMDLNKIHMELRITIRVLMGKEITPNQGFFESNICIREKQFWNDAFMSPFIRSFNEELRKNISISVNNHYANERNKNG